MSGEHKVTYYGLLDGDGKISGILRRTYEGPIPRDETFRRDLSWQPSEFLRRYYLGHNDNDYREMTPEEAVSLIAEWTTKWAQEDSP